jgi:hypothetical protein
MTRHRLVSQSRQRCLTEAFACATHAQVTTVRIDVRIRYQDQSQVTGARAGPRLASWVSPHGPLQPVLLEDGAASPSNTAQTSVSVSRSAAGDSVSTTASPASIVLYGALSALVVGVLATIALAVVAVSRRRRAARLVQCANNDSVMLSVIFQKRCVCPRVRLDRRSLLAQQRQQWLCQRSGRPWVCGRRRRYRW